VLQASTSEIYGDPTTHPQTEDYRGNVNPIGPRALRRRQTLRGGTVPRLPSAAWRARQVGAHLQHVRAGMHPNDGRLVPNFIVQALLGRPISCTATARRPAHSVTSMIWSMVWHA
jgi:UDP-glucuronate decarboxylase